MKNESKTTQYDYFIDAVADLILAYHVESSEPDQETDVKNIPVSNDDS
ncbi:hypothetical protein ACFPYN_13985 [Paenisporosarcina macmurdoensis]|uniref:Uncharacterized protein n=1 Tax=Paenisporosarcina macmurdoensis TaxID=212659 RepID=A0ABW1LBF0_9BACL